MSNEIGKQVAPFTVFSSSADGGYLTDLHTNFTGGVEISNLHQDEYGELVGAPLQGPYTYQWVGGHQHRHQEVLSTTDRGEAFHIKPGSSAIKVYGADYPDAHAARAVLTRDGLAKRAINIANLRTTTGSLSQGNYDHNIQVIQTSGKTQNPRHFAENSENYQQFAERKTQEGNVFNSIMVNMQVTNPAQDHANWIANNVISVTKAMTDQSGASLGSRTVAEFEGGTSVTLPTNLTSPSAFTETIPPRRMDSPYRYTGTITINADIGIGGSEPEESQGDILFFLVSKDDVKWHAAYIVGDDASIHGTYGAHIDLNVPYVANRLVTGTSITINPTTFGWSANQLYRVRIGQFFFASDLNDRYAIDNISITGNSFELEKSNDIGSLRNFALPTGSANKSIITNRFSAPGDRYTMSRGFLNPSGEEMSVYNTLPYRNENVRLNLRERLSRHMSSQGFEVSGSTVTTTGSFHKVNRNTLRQLQGGVEGTPVTTGSVKDNFFVQHPIPRSDLSYAWVTASISSTAMDSLYGYQKNSSDISFDLPQKDFTERTLFDYNPTTNTTLLPLAHKKQTKLLSIVPMPGAYGFSSWEAMRRTDYKSTRYIRDNNLFSFWTSGNKNYGNTTVVTQSAVTSKYKPIQHTATITGDESDTPFTFRSTYSNDLNYFGEQKSTDVEAKLNLYKNDDETFYATVKGYYIQPNPDNTNNPFGTVNKVRISETVYPKDKSAYTVGTRARSKYTEVVGTGDNGFDRQYGKQNTFFHPTKTRSDNTKNSFGFLSTTASLLAITENFTLASNLTPPTNLLLQNTFLVNDTSTGDVVLRLGYSSENANSVRYIQPSFEVSGTTSISFDFVKGTYSSLSLESSDTGEDLLVQYQNSGDSTWNQAFVKNGVNVQTALISSSAGSTIGNGSYSSIKDYFNTIASMGFSTNLLPLVKADGSVFSSGTKLRIAQPIHSGHLYDHYAIKDLSLSYSESINPPEHKAFFPLQTSGLKSFPISSSYEGKNGELLVDKDESAYTSNPTPSQCFIESTSLVKDGILSDYLERTTNTIAGVNPWEDSYDDYREDFRGLAKDMSVLPEFKISDHLDEYYKDFNFAKPPTDYLTLQGGDVAKGEVLDTGTENFFDRFTTSEPLRDYKQFLEDHAEEGLEIKSMKIKVDTVKKLLPYNGFYPMTRTVQLGNLLSASFIENVTGKEKGVSGFDTQGFQAISKTLMSPGILYNSVKAGYGVSYPIYKTTPTTKIDTRAVDKNVYEDFHVESAPDYQIPFDALLNPKGNIPENEDIIFTPSWTSTTPAAPAYDYSGQWNGTAKPQFQLGMHNFLAETVKFFLKDEQLVSHVSEPQKEGFDVEAGKTYFMDVVLRDSVKMDRMGTYSGTVTSSAESYFQAGGNTADFFSGSDAIYSIVLSRGNYNYNVDNKLSIYKNFLDGAGWINTEKELIIRADIPNEQINQISVCSGSEQIFVALSAESSTRYTTSDDYGFVHVYKYKGDKWQDQKDIVTSSLDHSLVGKFGSATKILPTEDNGYHLITSDTRNGGFSYEINLEGGKSSSTTTLSATALRGVLYLFHSSSARGLNQDHIFHDISNQSGVATLDGNFNNKRVDMVSASFSSLSNDVYPSGSMSGLLIVAGSPYNSFPNPNGEVCLFYSGSLQGTASALVPEPSSTTGKSFGMTVAAGHNNTNPNRKFYFATQSKKGDIGTVDFFTASVFSSSVETEIVFGKTNTYDATYLTSSNFPVDQSIEFGPSGYVNQSSPTGFQDSGLGGQLSIENSRTLDGQTDQVFLCVANNDTEYAGRSSEVYNSKGFLAVIEIDGNGYVGGDTSANTFGHLSILPVPNFNPTATPFDYIYAGRSNSNEHAGNLKIISGSGNYLNPSEELFVFSTDNNQRQNYIPNIDTPGYDHIIMHTGSAFTVDNDYTSSFDSTGNPVASPNFTASIELRHDVNYRKDGALYGQPIENAYDPAYSAYTPPSFYGTSVARVSYTAPEYGGKVTIPEIFRDATVQEIFEPDSNRSAKFYSKTNKMTALQKSAKMPLSSSVNLFGARIPRVDNAFDPRDVQWVIGSKFESPVLDFAPNDTAHSSSYTAKNQALMNSLNFVSNASHLPPRSMWTSYGTIPTDEKGITLEIKESFGDQGILNSQTTGSLMSLCKFEAQSKKIGQISTLKEISEAIVLIPYVKGGFGPSGIGNGKKAMSRVFKFSNSSAEVSSRSANVKQFTNNHSFIPIKTSTFNSQFKKLKEGEDPETTITKMIEGMERYILPPHMDFLKAYKKNGNKWTGAALLPFAMYFVEVDHGLDQQDLLNIWQGVMPKIARDFDGEEMSQVLEHDIDEENLFHKPELLKRAIKQDLSFMVFKVKKRAESNYFNVTKDSIDDLRFQFDFDGDGVKEAVPEYSYNWPYDFFSLIETAKVTIDLDLEEIPDPEPIQLINLPTVVQSVLSLNPISSARPIRGAGTPTRGPVTIKRISPKLKREKISKSKAKRSVLKEKVRRTIKKPTAKIKKAIKRNPKPKVRPTNRRFR